MIPATPRRPKFLEALLAACALIAPPALAADKPADKVFVGYLFGPTRNLDFRLYTHLCHAFVTADAGGNIEKASKDVPSRDLADRAHKAGVKMLISLGGWGYDDQFAAMAAKPEAEDRYVNAVLAMVDQADYDGLDLDWEYPDTKAEVIGFERLSRRLREGIDAIGRTERPADVPDDGRLGQPRDHPLARQVLPARHDGLDQRDDL